jgi:hypothetical protein
MAVSPSPAGWAKQGVVKQRRPTRKASRIPGSSEQPVRAGDDRSTFMEQLVGGETHSLPVDFDKSTVPAKIAAMCLSVTMEITVVLVNASSTDQPQVSPRDKAAPLIKDFLLRFDMDAGCLMQDSHN